MNLSQPKPSSIDDYIAIFPLNVQKLLKQVRKTIRAAAPEAKEEIKYAIPTYVLNGNLVHFAGYKNHIGLYPGPDALQHFKKEISVYKNAKGSVQFPIDKKLPLELITAIVKYRVKSSSVIKKNKL